ncbi:MAG: helix-turn-helix domain-containing protein [Bacteroidota bacterium]
MDILSHVIGQDKKGTADLLAQVKEVESTPTLEVKLSGADDVLKLSEEGSAFLLDVLSLFLQGKKLAVFSSEEKLTTQQAADLLDVYPTHINELIKEERLPYEKIADNYYFVLEDLVTYKQRMEEEREQHMQFLATQAQELNLGY